MASVWAIGDRWRELPVLRRGAWQGTVPSARKLCGGLRVTQVALKQVENVCGSG